MPPDVFEAAFNDASMRLAEKRDAVKDALGIEKEYKSLATEIAKAVLGYKTGNQTRVASAPSASAFWSSGKLTSNQSCRPSCSSAERFGTVTNDWRKDVERIE